MNYEDKDSLKGRTIKFVTSNEVEVKIYLDNDKHILIKSAPKHQGFYATIEGG